MFQKVVARQSAPPLWLGQGFEPERGSEAFGIHAREHLDAYVPP